MVRANLYFLFGFLIFFSIHLVVSQDEMLDAAAHLSTDVPESLPETSPTPAVAETSAPDADGAVSHQHEETTLLVTTIVQEASPETLHTDPTNPPETLSTVSTPPSTEKPSSDATETTRVVNQETSSQAVVTSSHPVEPPRSHSTNTLCNIEVSNLPDPKCQASNHRVLTRDDSSLCDFELPLNQWIRFVDVNQVCLKIPTISSGRCYKPGSCGTQYPYYITSDKIPSKGEQIDYDACMTDSTVTGHGLCCQVKVPVTVYNCGDNFYLYNFTQKMKSKTCGRYCTMKSEADISIFELIDHNSRLPAKQEELTEEQKKNLVSLVLEIRTKGVFESSYQSGEIYNNLKKNLLEGLNESRRRRRNIADLDLLAVDPTPRYLTDKEINLVLSVTDDEGNPIPKKYVQNVLKSFEGRDPALNSGTVLVKVGDVPDDMIPRAHSTLSSDGGEKDLLWIAILIILGVTAFIVAVCFLGVFCYNQARRRRSGTFNIENKQPTLLIRKEPPSNNYTPMNGHDNPAMEGDEADNNQNEKNVNKLDESKSVEPLNKDSAV